MNDAEPRRFSYFAHILSGISHLSRSKLENANAINVGLEHGLSSTTSLELNSDQLFIVYSVKEVAFVWRRTRVFAKGKEAPKSYVTPIAQFCREQVRIQFLRMSHQKVNKILHMIARLQSAPLRRLSATFDSHLHWSPLMRSLPTIGAQTISTPN